MLEELRIRNFAIIDEIHLKFQEGLNIFTGETGAGKSIIVDAIELIVGGRAEPEMVRTGFEESEIEAYFNIKKEKEIKGKLKENDLFSDDELILRRVISKTGKSRAFVNGKAVPVSLLKEIGRSLVDIHGQHQHQSLLNPESHIDFLDAFGGISELRVKFSQLYYEWIKIKEEIHRLKEDEKAKAEKIDFLTFQIRELEQANLEPDEEEKLKAEREILTHSEKFISFTSEGIENLYSKDGSVLEVLSALKKKAEELARIDPGMQEIVSLLADSVVQLGEVVSFLQKYSNKFNFDPARLDEIESRLALIGRLKKKYGESIQKILERLDELKKELERIESAGDKLVELEKSERELYRTMTEESEKLSKEREETSKKLKKGIESELKALGMEKAKFEIKIMKGDFTPSGADSVEFLLSTNPGEEIKPLAMVASGGELSRIMLALKNVLAGYSGVPVLIFDEIDTGIGGAVAEVVGRKLREVSKNHQVLCVTHLPQIACYANSHFYVSKEEEKGRTITRVKLLEKAERIDELARMLSGVELTRKSKEYAKELLERVS